MAYQHEFIKEVVQYAKSHSVPSASKKYKINNDIVSRWLQREKVVGSATKQTTFAEIKSYIDQHPTESYKKVAKALGLHFTTVAFCCRKNGLRRDRPKSDLSLSVAEFCRQNPTMKKKDIAEHFGISASYVSRIQKTNGLSADRREALLPLDVLAEFMQKNKGVTSVQIAKNFGVSEYTVRKKLRRIGMDRASREARAHDSVIAIAKEKPWLSYFDISSEFGISTAYVRRILREAGLRGYRRYRIKGYREYEKH